MLLKVIKVLEFISIYAFLTIMFISIVVSFA